MLFYMLYHLYKNNLNCIFDDIFIVNKNEQDQIKNYYKNKEKKYINIIYKLINIILKIITIKKNK